MRRFTLFLITLALSACIQEAEPHHPDNDRSGGDYYDGDNESCNGRFSLRWSSWTMYRASLNGEWDGWDGENWENFDSDYGDNDVEYEESGVEDDEFFRFSIEFVEDSGDDPWWSPANDGSGWETTGSVDARYECESISYEVVPTSLGGYEYLIRF